MRATEFIRQILDIVDDIECNIEQTEPPEECNDEQYVASIETMKTLAGGPNEPKHLTQMKSSTFPLHHGSN